MRTIGLPAGFILTVAADAISSGSLVRLADSAGGQPYSPIPVAASATVSVGPFATHRKYAVYTDEGTLTDTQAEADPVDKADTSALTALAALVTIQQNLHIYGAGVPVDYTDGTPPASGEGTSPKGALYTDTTNGFVYRNSGTLAQPLWTKLADVA